MKKQFLPMFLAVLVCMGGFLWIDSSRTALSDDDGLPSESVDFSVVDGVSVTAIPELEIRDNDVPLAEIPPVDGSEPVSSQGEENPWDQFSQTEMDTMHEVLRLVNQARAEAGLEPLELEPALCSAAQVRAQECVTTFSHTRPDGTKYKTAIAEAGITSNYTGENAATGHSSAKQVVDSWLRSEGHRANILNEKFTKLGVGFEKNTGNQYKGYAWVQLFIA